MQEKQAYGHGRGWSILVLLFISPVLEYSLAILGESKTTPQKNHEDAF